MREGIVKLNSNLTFLGEQGKVFFLSCFLFYVCDNIR